MKARPPVRKGPVARQSPVRKAHAAVARRNGRAALPGLLGLPEEVEQDLDASDRGPGHDEDTSTDRATGGRAPGRRPASRTAAESSGTRAPTRSSSANGAAGAAGAKRNGAGKRAATRRKQVVPGAGGSTGQRGIGPAQGRSGKQAAGAVRNKAAAGSGSDSGQARGAAAQAGKSVASGAATKAVKTASPIGGGDGLGLGALARRQARHAAAALARKAASTGAQAARSVAARAGASGAQAMFAHARRLPIQRSVDVAVPLEVAWDEWMRFDHLPEGAHRVKDVQRDGESLQGVLDSPLAADWEAEIIEERADESFAWRSIDGSDCVGLITFHRLGERLTRIELNLDVQPVRVVEAVALASHLADRRAGAELRRFKAHVELINPDAYDDHGDAPDGENDDDSLDEQDEVDRLDDGSESDE